MNKRPERIGQKTEDQMSKNLELTRRFLLEVIEQPYLLDELPDGTSLVLMPPDDPDLSMRNFSFAMEQAQAGKTVILQRVGVVDSDFPTWRQTERRSLVLQPITPRWPAERPKLSQIDWAITYERDADTLILDLYGRRHPGLHLPKNSLIGLWVDQTNHEIMGYVLSHFLEVIVMKAPQMINLLATADLVGIDEEEINKLRAANAQDFEARETLLSLEGQLVRLIA